MLRYVFKGEQELVPITILNYENTYLKRGKGVKYVILLCKQETWMLTTWMAVSCTMATHVSSFSA